MKQFLVDTGIIAGRFNLFQNTVTLSDVHLHCNSTEKSLQKED